MAYSIRQHSAITYGGFSTVTTGGVYHSLSFDDGLTWSSVYDNGHDFYSPPFTWCANGNIIGKGNFFPGASGLALSVDTCASLTKVSDISPSALLALPQGGVLVGTDTTGICLFSDNGDSLGTRNDGLTDLHIHTLAMDAENIYVGTNKGVWRRPVSELVVSVNPVASRLPQEFLLHQNYPNPLNPSTTIKYELPHSSWVSLTVFDILGREVSVLVNERREAGVHEVKFDGSNLASGAYFYRLQAGDFVQTKRLLLLK
jgi:Secretion system C-terminal sorting domain